jgi:hypothetical protein
MARTRANGLTSAKMREYARAGAEVTLERLRAEIAAIQRVFPELRTRAPKGALRGAETAATQRRRGMSAAARRVVSERMKRYWANRRKAKAAK